MPYGLSIGDKNGGSNRHDYSADSKDEDDPVCPNCHHFTVRRSGTISVSLEDHSTEEYLEHGVGEDDNEGNEKNNPEDNGNSGNSTNTRAGVRKGSIDEKAQSQNRNELIKSSKKDNNKECQWKTTKKCPSKRKKISNCCPCPTKTIPDAKVSRPSPKINSCSTKHPTCGCQCQEGTPPSTKKVCTVISQRICFGKRRAITKPMTLVH